MFFFDENIGLYIPIGLRGFGEEVIHILEIEELGAGTPDNVWLGYVGQNDLVLITPDRKIKSRPNERRAFFDHKVGAFILYGKDMDRWARVRQIVTAWQRIKELSDKTAPPYAFSVSTAGREIKRINLP
jgi:hypothetical protein